MKKAVFLFLISVCFFSCMEKPENDGEAQVPDAQFLQGEDKINLAIFIMENTEYLNILRGVVNSNDGVETNAYDEEKQGDAEDESIEDIENIAQLIPKTSQEDTLSFEDIYIVRNTSYRYCIRYRVNGAYYFSGWSKKVSVPDGKGIISSPYIIEGKNGADSLNIEYIEEDGTMTIRTIKESLLPSENSGYGSQFDENTERFDEKKIEINKNKAEGNEEGFDVSLVFHYVEDENIISRSFSIERLVNENIVSEDGTKKYYISSSSATNYNISVLVTPNFYEKDVVVDGFIGERITEEERWTQIVWTRITPVKLYNRLEIKNAFSNGNFNEGKDINEEETYFKQYHYKLMDTIKIPKLNNSDNKHDTSLAGPRAVGYAFENGFSYQSADVYARDFSTYCKW